MRLALLLLAALASACSSQTMYATGQQWQRNECNKINDTPERQRCLSKANAPYEDYKRDTEAAKSPK